MLTKADLYSNQYDYETLKTNIYCVSMLDILNTQKLNADFCIKYILNPNFQFSEEDEKITIELVKQKQPHISNIEFIRSQIIANIKKERKERIDSVEDFESYANRNS